MKKFVFGIVATVLFCNYLSFAQEIKASNKVSTSVKLIGKYHAVITFMETKEYYTKNMSEEDYFNETTSCIKETELKNLFRPYMAKIYSCHVKNLTSDQVYDLIDGADFANVENALRKYRSTPEINTTSTLRWFNWLRKLFDFPGDPVDPFIITD
jgi:hypothetical protein